MRLPPDRPVLGVLDIILLPLDLKIRVEESRLRPRWRWNTSGRGRLEVGKSYGMIVLAIWAFLSFDRSEGSVQRTCRAPSGFVHFFVFGLVCFCR